MTINEQLELLDEKEKELERALAVVREQRRELINQNDLNKRVENE